MTKISAPCPGCGAALQFAPNGRYGRMVASCGPCGDDYGLNPAGVGRLGCTPTAITGNPAESPR